MGIFNQPASALRIFSVIFVLSLPVISRAQNDNYDIPLKYGTLHPQPNVKAWFTQAATARQDGAPRQVLLQFTAIPTTEQRNALKDKGILLQDYVGGNAISALITSSASEVVENQFPLRSIINVQPEWKAEPFLWKKIDANPSTITNVIVAFNKNISQQDVRTFILSTGATIEKSDMEKRHCYNVRIPGNRLRTFASWYGIRYISPAAHYTPLDVEANGSDGTHRLNAPVSAGGFGLNGNGIVIGVGDNCSAITHVDINDRVIDYNPLPYFAHGLQTSAIAASAGIVDPKSAGVVPRATIVNHFYDYILANTPVYRDLHGMTITNNSYANYVGDTNFSGVYDVYSQAFDEISLERPDVSHIFAAGNDGYVLRPPYAAGYGNITGGYQPAKNNIVVSNNSKVHVNRHNSSRGPVNDGRLKPELSAIGNEVLVPENIDGYTVIQGGTSMACPQAAGVAGLLTERYRQINGNTNPRADLVKALILNAANDAGRPGPDFCYGFGYLNADRSRRILDSSWYKENTITNAVQQTYTINVPANTAQLKVMLTWLDKPASLMSTKQLVNDLDLEVVEPSTVVHYPLVLDPARPNVLNFAIEARDSLNNTEQVTINNPAAGTYTLRVKGFNVPFPTQDYVLAYDFVEEGIRFKSPVNGDAVATGDSLCIYWEAAGNTNPFTIEYSDNNGGSWNMLNNNISDTQRHYTWYVPNISSEQCRLRLTRNTTAQVTVSDSFVVAPQPVVKLDSSALCPGYIKAHWSPIPNATGYIVMRKIGPFMEAVATIIDTTYTFSGLSLDSNYYVAVQPLINGKPGYRSRALKVKPNSGNCAGSISNGDLMVEKILSPASGRQSTGTQLSNNETMKVRIRNLDNLPVASYTIHYAVNGAWNTQTGSNIGANASVDVNITGIDLSAPGSYILQAAIQNNSSVDNVSANDSARKVVRNLTNAVVNLTTPVTEGFESFGVINAQFDTMGLSPDQRWDYANTLPDSGRLRSYINDSFLLTGNRSMTMDMSINSSAGGAQNYLTSTYNFSTLDTSTEVRLDFDYILHGKAKFYDGNYVWVRGNDAANWIPVYHYDTAAAAGQVLNVGSLSISQALRSNGQNYSSSFQLRFGQNDTSLVGGRDFGNGTTFDNLKLYTLQNDMQMLSLLSPVKASCGQLQNIPVTIRIYNSVSTAQANVAVSYQVDNGAVVTETISSVAGYDTVDHTFSQQISSLSFGAHTLNVWLAAPGDDFLGNDSLKNIRLNSQPTISQFPFLENFESNDGYWYHEGVNSSWEYGTPSTQFIDSAASGAKAWVTNLDGMYNPQELSYLYTTCFDISSLDSPMLSFKLITDIENCGAALCDAAYLEYTYDNQTWTKLGANGQGTNWYNDGAFQVWNNQDTNWKEATLSLPVSTQPIRFRYVFSSDPGLQREGLGIDDFRIYQLSDTTVVDEEPFDGIKLGPNPSDLGYVDIGWCAQAIGDKMQVAISDVAGRIVFRADYTATAIINKTRVETGRFMTGVYVVKMIFNGKMYIRKVLFH